jgi:hypothetical protein
MRKEEILSERMKRKKSSEQELLLTLRCYHTAETWTSSPTQHTHKLKLPTPLKTKSVFNNFLNINVCHKIPFFINEFLLSFSFSLSFSLSLSLSLSLQIICINILLLFTFPLSSPLYKIFLHSRQNASLCKNEYRPDSLSESEEQGYCGRLERTTHPLLSCPT